MTYNSMWFYVIYLIYGVLYKSHNTYDVQYIQYVFVYIISF